MEQFDTVLLAYIVFCVLYLPAHYLAYKLCLNAAKNVYIERLTTVLRRAMYGDIAVVVIGLIYLIVKYFII